MEITEVRIKRMDRQRHGNLRAFISVTFDNMFVVKDIKIIEVNSRLRVVMPSRIISWRCSDCHGKNYWGRGKRYCSCCGAEFAAELLALDEDESPFVDIAHPINVQARQWLEDAILTVYRQEINNPQATMVVI